MTETDQRICAHGKAALAALCIVKPDGVMSAKKTLAMALDELVHMRDQLIGAARSGHGNAAALNRTNAIISSLFGTEFPSGAFQWKRVQEACQALQSLVGELDSTAR